MRVASSEPNSCRAFRPRRLAAQAAGQPAQPGHLQRLCFDHQLCQLLTDMAFAPGRFLTTGKLFRQFQKTGELGCVVAAAGADTGFTLQGAYTLTADDFRL